MRALWEEQLELNKRFASASASGDGLCCVCATTSNDGTSSKVVELSAQVPSQTLRMTNIVTLSILTLFKFQSGKKAVRPAIRQIIFEGRVLGGVNPKVKK